MSRRVITLADAQRLRENRVDLSLLDEGNQSTLEVKVASDAQPDDYTTKLIKLIPAEVVTVFVTLDGIIRSNGKVPDFIYWIVFAVLVVACYLYMSRVTKVDGLANRKSDASIACVSFVVWVFAIGGPFTYSKLAWYNPVYGAILLPLYTFLVPLAFPRVRLSK
jgi:hypothetical protein